MSATEQSPCTGLGLFQSFFQPPSFSHYATNAAQLPDQWMSGLVRSQLGLQGLMFRRAQAYLELPSRMAQCRSLQDLMAEQQRFIQTCLGQYSQSSQQIMGTWAQLFQLPMPEYQPGMPYEHDYLGYPDQRSTNGAGTSQHQTRQGQRRAA